MRLTGDLLRQSTPLTRRSPCGGTAFTTSVKGDLVPAEFEAEPESALRC